MADPTPLPLPERCRTVAEALGAARNANLPNVVIVSNTADGLLILSAKADESQTAAETLWLLAKAQNMLVRGYE